MTSIYMKDVPEICSIISKLGFIFNSMYRFSSMSYWVVTILWVGCIIPVGILWKFPLQFCSWMCIWGDTLDLINEKMNVFNFLSEFVNQIIYLPLYNYAILFIYVSFIWIWYMPLKALNHYYLSLDLTLNIAFWEASA